ncbi:conserved hypothetical protein, partial [Trichinella spiralis]|uniref:hypothetical protein n=1 Tax=Trichinella spiralis TaxID=6334 RepID=UPI0001EFDAC2
MSSAWSVHKNRVITHYIVSFFSVMKFRFCKDLLFILEFKTVFTNHGYEAAVIIAGLDKALKDAAGEKGGWLMATDLHDRTRRYPISHCTACRLVIDPRARRSLMVRWGIGSKPPRNKPLIYRRAASRGL